MFAKFLINEKTMDFTSKGMAFIAKIGIFIGGLCIGLYSLKNGHFPQGITLGDGFLFLITAGCFGFVYILFVASLTAMGVLFSPVIRPLLNIVFWSLGKLAKNKTGKEAKPKYQLKKFRWKYFLFTPVLVPMLIAFGRSDKTVYLTLTLLAIALYMFYSIYEDMGRMIKSTNSATQGNIDYKEKPLEVMHSSSLKKDRSAILFIIIFLPIAMGGVTGQLLDSAMRAANIRIDITTAYIQEPYYSLLTTKPTETTAEKFKKIENLTVIFRGFGRSSLVSYLENNKLIKLEIPNEKIIIPRKTNMTATDQS